MSIHDELCACFQSYDPQAVKDLHHEDFMMVRELELSTRDEHCEIINELAVKPDWDQHLKAEVVHENAFCVEWRWKDRDEIVTNVSLKKDGKLWRSIISKIPKNDTLNPNIYRQLSISSISSKTKKEK